MRKQRLTLTRRRTGQLESLETRTLLAGDLIAQWRADDLNTTLDDQAPVTNWLDTVAAIEGTATGQPTLVKQAVGGRSAIRFTTADGADGFKIQPQASPMRDIADFTIVVALATSSQELQGGQGDWFANSGIVDGNVQGFGQDWGLTMNAAGQVAVGLGGGFVKPKTTIYSDNGLNDGQIHVVAATRHQSDLSLYVDDALAAQSRHGRRCRSFAAGHGDWDDVYRQQSRRFRRRYRRSADLQWATLGGGAVECLRRV